MNLSILKRKHLPLLIGHIHGEAGFKVIDGFLYLIFNYLIFNKLMLFDDSNTVSFTKVSFMKKGLWNMFVLDDIIR